MSEKYNPIALRRLTAEDVGEYYDLFDINRDHISRYDERLKGAFTTLSAVEEQLAAYSVKDFQHYAIEKRGEMVGAIALMPKNDTSAEISFWIDRQHIQQGLATVASRMLMTHAFEWEGVNRIDALIAPTNHPGKRVVENLGFNYSHSRTEEEVYSINERHFKSRSPKTLAL